MLSYFVLINVVTFFYFGIDKIKAKIQSRRVSETSLWVLSAIGGSIGAIVAMKFFRHKTRKISFQAGMSVILAIQIILIMFYIKNL